MASKNITIKEASYDRLKAMKRPDESFSDLIDRLTRNEGDVRAGFGVFAGESEPAFSDVVDEERTRMERESAEREERVFE
ncbi:antitoxin VapB family protein [Halococcus hamelinensis]|uniref:Antitoxin n=1 Tax=Halococcus hamelinensis 100A6 TaxID=1132509 RepID=M0M8E8_9EURY|nr:antitoxin VapB family protein [Halococcus hamelinensis]EMA40680.1 hypothetical protein C447_04141 [Halococcus hamelinensis 100A6]